ncbi:hypothetical protein OIU84_016560 [Salix udensis]|uniref:Bifunctional inhibitor/plant lipid transfer protein/seed storage helical domain-containing protein n=1 Tax=Salix udensis TaxID=889485 RepID=A0AAD6JBP7_9ROSI|nr:hypothetical protein OIU84_016560 [Salix udensis]
MENLKVFMFTFMAVSLLLVLGTVNGQLLEPRPQRPLCASQIALVNYACGSLLPAPPAASLPSATAASDDHNSHGNRHEHGHGHGHRHGHRHGGSRGHGHGGTPEENCCRWLNDVDAECVCELLVRLPPFLSKPPHEYTVKIDDSCTVSYSCGLIK